MKLIVYYWEEKDGSYSGKTVYQNKVDFRTGFESRNGCRFSFLGTYSRKVVRDGFGGVCFINKKPTERDVYFKNIISISEPKKTNKRVYIKTDKDKKKTYFYKKEGNILTVYEKVLVKEYPL